MEKTAGKTAYIPDFTEAAVVARSPGDVEACRGVRRVYFGCEFCDRLLPSAADVKRMEEACSAAGVKLTLLTPLCMEPGLKKVRKLIAALPAGMEIVVNDWGVLRTCLEMGVKPAAGRLLISASRDPRYSRVTRDFNPSFAEYIRASSMNSAAFAEFLLSSGIERIELDNTGQFYGFDPPARLRCSLHFPWVFSSVTRLCLYPFAFGEGRRRLLNVSGCTRECRGAEITFHADSCALEMTVMGNAQFYRNESLPGTAELKKLHIDRIVFADGDSLQALTKSDLRL